VIDAMGAANRGLPWVGAACWLLAPTRLDSGESLQRQCRGSAGAVKGPRSPPRTARAMRVQCVAGAGCSRVLAAGGYWPLAAGGCWLLSHDWLRGTLMARPAMCVQA
jgi:hypothetical protein